MFTVYNKTMPTMTEELFVKELDGMTFANLEELYDWMAVESDGPVWSNYGGWVN
ncbi:hypothetical protein ACIP6P_00765 [Streptomyces sp. NPDC088729]|uniref:hypothetical protein n=1 Tax=Streptomyces sp. NPDC088729 TaxID=3365876 RepID=UPI0038284192